MRASSRIGYTMTKYHKLPITLLQDIALECGTSVSTAMTEAMADYTKNI
jgi:hypothetical protein